MRTNIEILLDKLKADEITHGGTEQDYIDQYGVYGTITDAMKEAQSEIIFRFVENVESYPNYEAPYPFRFQMSSEKTKRELEEGKEYSWFEFIGRRHKGL